MPNLVIVALPSEDDYVNRISSEKVAHMTLLFLGDVGNIQNLSKILEFTEHASKGLKRFGLEVDRRGELGEDKADVLFFRKSKWGCYPDLVQFRSDLLKENNIRLAYDSTEQYEQWQPHLTLGYPEAPAKKDNRDYPGISYVNFDRIAVWFKEFEGVEFPLANWDEDYVLMSDLGQDIVNELIHISEKPWGDYTEADYTLEQWHKACLIHLHDGSPTSKADCKLPVRTPGGALNRNGVHAALAALHGARSPLKASAEQKAKAASKLRSLYKQLGEDIPESLSQSDIIEVGEDFLEHFGIKGMKWGHRSVHPDIAHVPKSTRKEASKDAEEFTRAKLYFGVGAGTRRKLIKATVESKSKKDPLYKHAFEHFVTRTDLGQRAVQARKERKRTDRLTFGKKTLKGVGHILRGNNQYANTTAAISVAAAGYLYHNPQQRQALINKGSKIINSILRS